MWSLVLVLWHTKDESFWENHSNFQIQCRLYCEIFVRVVASSFTGICINPAFCWVSRLWLQKNLLIPRGKRVCGVKSWRKGMALQGGYFSRNDLCQCHSFDLVVCFFWQLYQLSCLWGGQWFAFAWVIELQNLFCSCSLSSITTNASNCAFCSEEILIK